MSMTRLTSSQRRRGFFLVLVLIVIVVATMAAYSFTGLMLAYDESAYLAGDLVQARVAVESGAEAIRLLLAQPPDMRYDYGGVINNPTMFQAVNVSQGIDGLTPCNFTVVAPDLNEVGQLSGLRFGLQNESARLNINTLAILSENSETLLAAQVLASQDDPDAVVADDIAISLLMALPGMTEDVADAILDWLDEDEEARELGAEAEYYNTLETPYSPANGPMRSVEELLLVRGVTPTLLFGADINRNGMLDPDEQTRFNASVDTPGALGWAAYLTVHGAEANKRSDGSLRVNVNKSDLEVLYEDLLAALGDETYASFIVAYRIAGQSSAVAAASGGGNRAGGEPWSVDLLDQLDLSGGGGTEFTQILDVIDATVSIEARGNTTTYSSPFASDIVSMALYLPLLMDALSTQDVDLMPGRINLNRCPAELLYGIPILDEETVDLILEARQQESDDPNRQYETWPMVEGIVTLDQMRQLLPLWTGGGDVYRAQIVGYFETIGASHRSEVIFDATTVNPKIIGWRDLSHLGRGFDLSVLGMRSNLEMTLTQ
tara:strand:+ start:196346 stop:197986 length:1641 start_codon:yes stop_codon:yes gene_type:complete